MTWDEYTQTRLMPRFLFICEDLLPCQWCSADTRFLFVPFSDRVCGPDCLRHLVYRTVRDNKLEDVVKIDF